jgi:hypothetical protein
VFRNSEKQSLSELKQAKSTFFKLIKKWLTAFPSTEELFGSYETPSIEV